MRIKQTDKQMLIIRSITIIHSFIHSFTLIQAAKPINNRQKQ